jgi:hypothetical protein
MPNAPYSYKQQCTSNAGAEPAVSLGCIHRQAVLPIGHAGEHGMVAVGSQQPEFPTNLDRLLLDSSLHQAVIALQEVRLVATLREANLLKD